MTREPSAGMSTGPWDAVILFEAKRDQVVAAVMGGATPVAADLSA